MSASALSRWVSRRASGLLERIEHDSLKIGKAPVSSETVLGWLLDMELIAVIVWAAPLPPWDTLLAHVFPPFILIALARLLPRVLLREWVAWLEDRAQLALILALAAFLGVLDEGVQVLAMLLALAALALTAGKPQITRAKPWPAIAGA